MLNDYNIRKTIWGNTMNNSVNNSAHWSFWLIAVLLLIWNAMGAVNFVMQLNPEMVASYRDNERAMIVGRPLWATMGFALSVFGGVLGCVCLLCRKPIAIPIFIVSLIGTLIVVGHSLSLNIRFGVGEMIGILFLPIAISAFLVWYAKFAQKKGWLRNC